MTKKGSEALIVFLKYPEIGKVKTRIGQELGHEEAVRIYHLLLKKVMSVVSAIDAVKLLFYSGKVFSEPAWPVFEAETHQQSGADLGKRMHHSFEVALERFSKAVIIGTDCPYLTIELLKEAFNKLETVDVVIGPAVDGGYYLLGMKTLYPELFNGIAWSTDEVFTLTLERIKTLGLAHHCLPVLSDIDLAQDWAAYQKVNQ